MSVVWGLMRANSVGWMSLEIVSALAAGILLAVGFVLWELRARQAMVPMRLFRSRAFSSGIAASFLFYAAMYGTLFFLPQFLQVAQGQGPFDVVCDSCRRPPCCSSSRRSVAALLTDWASVRSSSPGSGCKRSA
jgi:hypothetical protein